MPPALRRLAAALLLLTPASCATYDTHTTGTPPPPTPAAPWAAARIVEASSRLECVTYARQVTKFDLRGDAWTWWNGARGRYQRGRTPQPGALLVLKRVRKSAGHLAVVTQVIDDRTIIASHANWLNRGRIHENTPIRDVSPAGDWSSVRVWYTPGKQWGASAYPAYGFVYPTAPRIARR
jgi:hypothetical protein